MKHCPTCKREYDDSLRFCLEDGTQLEANDTAFIAAGPTMVLPGNESAGTTAPQVARANAPAPRDGGQPTEPAAGIDRPSSSSPTTARLVIAALGVISLIAILIEFAGWGYIAVRRIPITILFLGALMFALVRAGRHPKVSLLVGFAIGFDLIETAVYIGITRTVSQMQPSWSLTGGQMQTIYSVLTVLDDFALAVTLVLLTMAVLTGRKQSLQTSN